MRPLSIITYVFLICIFYQCKYPGNSDTLFVLQDNKKLNIDFINQLEYTEELNTYTFRNFYNGGGVALGDINNDGLIDIFLSGNLVDNKLYLNKGDWQFEDISEIAGIESKDSWSMGVSMADVNGDDFLDIYVCKSGPPGGPNRNNVLYINNGDLTFTDKSEAYRVADEGLSTHAAFFDYDKDGDLDFYLLNNSIRSVGGYDFRPGQREISDPYGGNKLYRNDGDHFTDVTEEAGIYNSSIGFGLGVTVGDINQDGWQDLYISNDFFERDYLYINNGDGTFTESLEEYIREISLSSMGADMADLNNDGYPEIFVTDMLPSTDRRIKTKTTFDNWDKYQLQLQNGYYKQFTRNALQLNNGDGTFSEISRKAGVEATDWSWGALIFDMDNDGMKDIFVANGIFKDLTDQDYVNFVGDPRTVRDILRKENQVIKRLIDSIPSEPLPNCAFHNMGNMEFEEIAGQWGLGKPSFSNGAAYGDLDNDGDLDLVINNVNMPPFIYKNQATDLFPNRHFLTIQLRGNQMNRDALGAKIKLHAGDHTLYQEHMPMRSYQSTTDHRLHFGLGEIKRIDSMHIIWPDLTISRFYNLPLDTFIVIDYLQVQKNILHANGSGAHITHPVFSKIDHTTIIDYKHVENEFVDFDRERLIPQMLSNEGPCMCVGDVNSDGLDDIYLGGAKNQPGTLFMQLESGVFIKSNENLFASDLISEDTDCRFFDADSDGDLDLYVCSGGNEFPSSSSALLDRLYINDGSGQFVKSTQMLPIAKYISSSCVRPIDFDGDGDMDLFVGGRLIPFAYGTPASSYLLENNGNGEFRDISAKKAPGLQEIGMVKDALWSDTDKDGDYDLIIVGEWMPVKLFRNDSGSFIDITDKAGLSYTSGFWNCVVAADLDNDGYEDLIAGNHGLNSRIKATREKPASMYVNDFDGNGTIEQIICTYNGEQAYPIVLRQDLVAQLPYLKNKYLKFKNYGEQTIHDIFSEDQIESSLVYQAHFLESAVFWNDGQGNFSIAALPDRAQISPVFAIHVSGVDQDQWKDIIIGGNFYRSKPELGIYDASYGLLLKGQGDKNFNPLHSKESGILIKGEIRKIEEITIGNKWCLAFARNNDSILILENKTMIFQ